MHCKMCKMWRSLFFILLNNFMAESFPVFSFTGITSPQKSPSSAFLVEEILLPDNFVLCSSVKQAMFDDVGFYTINGNDSQEWLGMEFRTFFTETKLTVRRGQNIHTFGKLMSPRLDYWYHICMRLDLNGNEIEVAVNGRLLGEAIIDVTNMPNKLNMKLGVGYEWNQQFHGSVANTQMFSDGKH